MSNVYKTGKGLMMSDSGNYQQNPDGTWSDAIPLPFYGLRKHCPACSAKFWKEANYVEHYKEAHTCGKKWRRTPTGMVEL